MIEHLKNGNLLVLKRTSSFMLWDMPNTGAKSGANPKRVQNDTPYGNPVLFLGETQEGAASTSPARWLLVLTSVGVGWIRESIVESVV